MGHTLKNSTFHFVCECVGGVGVCVCMWGYVQSERKGKIEAAEIRLKANFSAETKQKSNSTLMWLHVLDIFCVFLFSVKSTLQ